MVRGRIRPRTFADSSIAGTGTFTAGALKYDADLAAGELIVEVPEGQTLFVIQESP